MSRVFISHSRHDIELIKNIANLLENIGEETVVMEYTSNQAIKIPPFEIIRNEVQNSSYMMLFKTDNAIKTEYTKSWINFEVGLASATNKRLFVFERIGSSIHFPIPYLTDYMLFDPKNVSDMIEIQTVAKNYKKLFKKKKGKKNKNESGLGFLFLFAPQFVIALIIIGIIFYLAKGPYNLTCHKCMLSFNYYGIVFDRIQCPSCLTQIELSKLFNKDDKNLIKELREEMGFRIK